MTKVAIIDYGKGNVRSVRNAIHYCGADALVTCDESDIDDASHIILPGVGAFGDAMDALNDRGLPEVLYRQAFEKGKAFLGVCVGMQVLAKTGYEHGEHQGLGWFDADVVRMESGPDCLKIPHMGWSTVDKKAEHPVFRGFADEQLTFYFVHSYHLVPRESDVVLGSCNYSSPFVAALARDNIVTTQFHPEKSQDSGIELLENFIGWTP